MTGALDMLEDVADIMARERGAMQISDHEVVEVSTDAKMSGMDGGALAEASRKVSTQESGMTCVMFVELSELVSGAIDEVFN